MMIIIVTNVLILKCVDWDGNEDGDAVCAHSQEPVGYGNTKVASRPATSSLSRAPLTPIFNTRKPY